MDPVSSGAQRIPPYRPCQGHLPRFRAGRRIWRRTNLRFDDTNPSKEETEYVDSIQRTSAGWALNGRPVLRLGLFRSALRVGRSAHQGGQSLRCDLSAEEIREYRGTLTEPGKESPYRNRSVEREPRPLRAHEGREFPDGSRTLRAKIDMASPNLNMRDPVMYRILHAEHHRTGDKWCIYPMYDYAHGQSDSSKTVTHSICTLEFEDHRPLYNWFIEQLGIFPSAADRVRPAQPTYTLLSKRKLLQLVQEARAAAGTIRACRRSRACGAAATRRKQSAILSRDRRVARPTASSSWRCWSTSVART